jgi:hypothetical protein
MAHFYDCVVGHRHFLQFNALLCLLCRLRRLRLTYSVCSDKFDPLRPSATALPQSQHGPQQHANSIFGERTEAHVRKVIVVSTHKFFFETSTRRSNNLTGYSGRAKATSSQQRAVQKTSRSLICSASLTQKYHADNFASRWSQDFLVSSVTWSMVTYIAVSQSK